MRGSGIDSSISDKVLKITLNRPDRMNILGVEIRRRMLDLLRAHESDENVRCVVISSSGPVFSAGADLNYLVSLDKKGAKAYSKFVRSFLQYLEEYPKPTIGLVRGLAVGGGLELLMTLDVVIATPNARLGQTELNVGLIPGGGGTQRLPRLVGLRKAKEMVYTGALISAQEALSIGLVNKVVEEDQLEAESSLICNKIQSKSPAGLRMAKEAMNAGRSMSLDEALKLESRLYSRALSGPEAKRRIRAFLQRRGQKK
ncbi:MAG: enoyl-CoA hydratase/isomerase family protein [Thaumarchaeota archaeon]|nr:enoyl-CoA hydratase/isomerase family protein [Nitrososphaerota archaeon]